MNFEIICLGGKKLNHLKFLFYHNKYCSPHTFVAMDAKTTDSFIVMLNVNIYIHRSVYII